MGGTLWILRSFLLRGFRDRMELFWNFAFPLMLMTILILIFGGLTDTGQVRFKVALMNMESNPISESFAGYIEGALKETAEMDNSWLELITPDEGEDLHAFRNIQNEALEAGDIHVMFIISEGFDRDVLYQILQGGDHAGLIEIKSRPDSQFSVMAAGILEQFVGEFNKEVGRRGGFVDGDLLVNWREEMVDPGTEGRDFSYVEYILPGILLATFLFSGLLNVSEGLTDPRDKGILRRFFATPLAPSAYFLGLFLYVMVLAVIQIILITIFGRVFFDIHLNVFALQPLLYLAYGLFVLMGMGLFIASVTKSANSAGTFANVVLYPMMFLGGLYFPVMNMPWPLQGVVLVNPVTYLANGLRDTLAVFPSPTSTWVNLLIPAIWLIVTVVVSLKVFRWEVD